MNNFFAVSPVSSALMCSTAVTGDKPGAPAKGAFFPEENKDKRKESQQQAFLTHVVEEFFWIGSSIVAFSKWRLGYMGKLSQIQYWVGLGQKAENQTLLLSNDQTETVKKIYGKCI